MGRYIKPSNFRKIINISLHNFSDASEIGYGQCSYLRVVDENENIHCSLIMGKARVAPKKFISIPRLELVDTILSVKISNMIKKELQLQELDEYFWTDSRILLGYIANDTTAFKTFVANRVHIIQENSNVEQWKYVPSKENAADDASRGMNFKNFANIDRWFQGPKFLRKSQSSWETSSVPALLQTEDPKLKKQVKTNKIAVKDDLLGKIEEKYSCWLKLKRIIALMLKWKINAEKSKKMMPTRLKKVLDFSINNLNLLDIEMLQEGEMVKKKMVQLKYFNEELKLLKMKNEENVKISSKISSLNPYLHENRIIRVGGRLEKSYINNDCKHPILMPKNCHISKLIILWCHQKTGHSGSGMTLNEVRSSGFWIVNANSVTRPLIHHCVTCRNLRGKLGEKLMSELPSDRLQESPPFTYCGVDLFGPFTIKNYRKELKRYGVMFTCLCSRAIHIEVAQSLKTDSFIISLRGFIGRGGNIRLMRSDNGSNLFGTINELRKAFQEMDHNQISQYLQTHRSDWIT